MRGRKASELNDIDNQDFRKLASTMGGPSPSSPASSMGIVMKFAAIVGLHLRKNLTR